MATKAGIKTLCSDFFGNKPYQKRARAALPIIVRQVLALQTITYGELADELGDVGPRNLSGTLGLIGKTLENLSQQWKETIPHIQAIVVTKATGTPGKGINVFFGKNLPKNRANRKQFMLNLHRDIFSYKKWYNVLKALNLEPNIVTTVESKDIKHKRRGFGSGGEGEDHKRFKTRIAKHPELLKLKGFATGKLEHTFLTNDTIDVYFSNENTVVGVEVKSRISEIEDVRRGLFQCKKYEALIDAEIIVKGERKNSEVILALEGEFPKELLPTRNVLSVNCIDKIK
ncbi:hypothetical protein R80B4_02815 [Fibrobacteres bacterium R8-0-B4]